RAEPGRVVGEFFLQVSYVIPFGQGVRQLTNFLDEPHPGPRRPAGAIDGFVALANVLLKTGEREGGWEHGGSLTGKARRNERAQKTRMEAESAHLAGRYNA